MTNSGVDQTDRMIVTRTFDAIPHVVWKAWTDPRYVVKWWGPKGFTAPICRMDFRVGGTFLYCMTAPDGQEFWTGGEYHEIVPYERIVLSMYFADSDGNKVDPSQDGINHEAMDDVHDVVVFESLGNGQTKLTFVGNETMKNAIESGQVEGWHQILEKFAVVVADLAQAI